MKRKGLNNLFNVPFITEEGTIDMFKLPLDLAIKNVFSDDEVLYRGSLSVLGSMVCEKRIDAGIFLMGLISYYKNDIKRLEIIVEKLRFFKTKKCADFLFDELIRTESNNTIRIYLNIIIDILSRFPSDLIINRFKDLSKDKRFSYRMRNKFLQIVKKYQYNEFYLD